MKWVVSCLKEDGQYSYHIDAESEEEALTIGKELYGETAKVDGKLFMGFECAPENVEAMKRKVAEICALKNAKSDASKQ
ncbi:MAG: hypothetical protein FJ368_03170 [Pelagibacterales bacterium]|nr:hypothetical protein [Pelagibacterales bacterium]